MIKTKKGGKYENQNKSVWARYVPLTQKMLDSRHFMSRRQRMNNNFDCSYPNEYKDKLATIKLLLTY